LVYTLLIDKEGNIIYFNECFDLDFHPQKSSTLSFHLNQYLDESNLYIFLNKLQNFKETDKNIEYLKLKFNLIDFTDTILEWELSTFLNEFGDFVGILAVANKDPNLKKSVSKKSDHQISFDVYKSIIESINVGIWEWEVPTEKLFLNRTCAKLLGHSGIEELELSFDSWLTLLHPDDLQIVMDPVKELFDKKETYAQVEIRKKKKNGDWHWFEFKVKLVKSSEDGTPLNVIGTLQDINERKLTAEKLKESEIRLMGTLSNMLNVAVQWYKEDTEIIFWNLASTFLYELTPEETIGKKSVEVFGQPEGSVDFQSIINRVKSGGKPYGPFETIVNHKDGQDITLQCTVFAFPMGNNETGYVCMDVDITALKKAENSLTNLLNTASIQNTRLKDFSFMTSHNLRSSVVNLLGIIEILEMDMKDNPLLEMLKRTVDKLDATIRTMNKLIQFETDSELLEMEVCYPNKIINGILDQISQSAQKKDVDIEVSLSDELSVMGNPAYLESIFNNLITNAIKYGITEKSNRIEISGRKQGLKTFITIKDFGLGMDYELIKDKIFKPGSRFHSAKAEGQGLGLFMIKRQVEIIGASIDFETEIEKGTTFNLTFHDKI
jgi:PAS domain S-box-containing protein